MNTHPLWFSELPPWRLIKFESLESNTYKVYVIVVLILYSRIFVFTFCSHVRHLIYYDRRQSSLKSLLKQYILFNCIIKYKRSQKFIALYISVMKIFNRSISTAWLETETPFNSEILILETIFQLIILI